MREHWVHVEHDFDAPVEEVFAHLAEHENLAAVFGAKVERVRDGDTDRNGTGSVRRLRIGPLPPFEETVTGYVPNELIEYRITRGSPLKGHVGTMRFSERPQSGTHLDYRIRIASAIPGVAPLVSAGLSRNIPKGLRDGVPGGS